MNSPLAPSYAKETTKVYSEANALKG